MKYICKICGYIYDEAKEETPFASLAEDWKCPVCTAPKAEFREDIPAETITTEEISEEKEPAVDASLTDAILGAAAMSDNPALSVIQTVAAMTPEKEKDEKEDSGEEQPADNSYDAAILTSVAMSDDPALNIIQTLSALRKELAEHASDPDMKRFSVGQLAALCSNMARACEKQYKEEEASLFRELAAFFAEKTPAIEDASVEALAKALQADIDGYGDIRKCADAAGDRGAARVSVWGEKVTLMLSSLVTRYLQNGEALLADTDVWVCTACGFVFIGNEPPAQCPICKVPDWKFEKIERRAAK